MSSLISPFNVAITTFGLSAFIYFLFQKKLLSKSLTKIVARIFFYPTFPITAALRIGNYWTHIDDTVTLGCAPFNILGHPKLMWKDGIRGVVNMCDEYPGPRRAYDELGIKQLRLPAIDHFEASLVQMQEAIKFINLFKQRGERVYVHCKAGHGRAASIALCWLIYQNPEMTPKDLNAVLSKKRKVRKTLFEQTNVKSFYEYSKTIREKLLDKTSS